MTSTSAVTHNNALTYSLLQQIIVSLKDACVFEGE